MQAPLPPCPEPGTPDWAQWQLRHTFTTDADRKAITDCVAWGMVPYPLLSRARIHYAAACHAQHWPGWQARLVWAVIEAILKPAVDDDDIPF